MSDRPREGAAEANRGKPSGSLAKGSAGSKFAALCLGRLKEEGGDPGKWMDRAILLLWAALEAWEQEHGERRVSGFCDWAFNLSGIRVWQRRRAEAGAAIPERLSEYLKLPQGGLDGPEEPERALERHGFLCLMLLGGGKERRRFAELAAEADEELEAAARGAGLRLGEWPQSEEAAARGVLLLAALIETREIEAASREGAARGALLTSGARRV